MADMMEYKCPACGGAMEFNSATQNMKCPYCDTEMSVQDYEKTQGGSDTKETSSEENWSANGKQEWEEGETKGMRVYSCKSCGGEIIADETTGASSCPFCGNPVVMKGQFHGKFKPDYIIPFKLDKKAAKEAYLNHLKGKKFLPSVFKQENHIDEIKGIYVPFWVFNAKTDADICYHAEKLRVWRKGNTEYTEHQEFAIRRAGTIDYSNVPVDCSEKMDDTLMESIEPYKFEEAVPFATPYLAGYAADRYDVESGTCIRRAEERIRNSTISAFTSTVQGYHNVTPTMTNIHVKNAGYWYALYPVWILNTTWKDKKYVFAMNGQTGKLVGDLPADNTSFWKAIAGKGILFAAVLFIIQFLLGI